MSEFIVVNRKRLVHLIAAVSVCVSLLTGLACTVCANCYIHTIMMDTCNSIQETN